MSESLVDPRGTVLGAVTPHRGIDARVQLRAAVLTVVGLEQEQSHPVGRNVPSGRIMVGIGSEQSDAVTFSLVRAT